MITMTKLGKAFNFSAPTGWSQLHDGNRQVFHGPNREELIVSASLIQGIGSSDNLKVVQQRLFQNAEESVKSAAAHPALKVTQPFQKDTCVSHLECWSLHSETLEGDTLFYQAIFRDPRGIMIATLEAPNAIPTQAVFHQFVNSVTVLSETEAFDE